MNEANEVIRHSVRPCESKNSGERSLVTLYSSTVGPLGVREHPVDSSADGQMFRQERERGALLGTAWQEVGLFLSHRKRVRVRDGARQPVTRPIAPIHIFILSISLPYQ